MISAASTLASHDNRNATIDPSRLSPPSDARIWVGSSVPCYSSSAAWHSSPRTPAPGDAHRTAGAATQQMARDWISGRDGVPGGPWIDTARIYGSAPAASNRDRLQADFDLPRRPTFDRPGASSRRGSHYLAAPNLLIRTSGRAGTVSPPPVARPGLDQLRPLT
jgi:hypothetical protein